ncbi:hypothetical protein FOZ63_021818 [Perkinsus olseni]|uniref:Integrase catalytic domain-containing protein n=1 Tax=Perkinsus olseni TaxID=32597 RepID=A0A7J6SLX3_PEROL|nr:hypothetical protein FOZ63_021818 [Perkinsus olseni]
MLIGMDLIVMIGCTLNLLGFADDLQHPINSFFTYGDNHSYTSHSTTKINDIDSSGKLHGPIEYPPPPSGHVVVDTVMTSPWLEITVRKKDDDDDTSPKWFHIDLSNQATSLAFQQQFRRVPEYHWRMKMTTEEGKEQVQQKLDGFIENDMMEIVDNDSRNIFTSNIYAVRGRKRWRPVAPYLNINTMLRSFMSAYKIANPQTKIFQCLNRLRLSESCKLLDIQDAFMRVHIGCNLASMTMIMYKGRTYRFQRMLYGQALAPLTLELIMSYLAKKANKLNDPILSTPVIDSTGDYHVPPLTHYMDDILIFNSRSDFDKLLTNYSLPTTEEPLPEHDFIHTLGILSNQNYIKYNDVKYCQVHHIDSSHLTFSSALSLLAVIVSEPSDVLPLHVLPVKHRLISLVGSSRHTLDKKWSDPLPDEIAILIRSWQTYVKETPLPVIPRRLHPHQRLDLYCDASNQLLCFIGLQNDKIVLQHQTLLTPSESYLHANVLEMYSAFQALTRLVEIESDSTIRFSDVHFHLDSVTAISVLETGRVSSRNKQDGLQKKYLALFNHLRDDHPLHFHYIEGKHNIADAGTRSDLLLKVNGVWAKYHELSSSKPTSSKAAQPIRKRQEDSPTDNLPKKPRITIVRHSTRSTSLPPVTTTTTCPQDPPSTTRSQSLDPPISHSVQPPLNILPYVPLQLQRALTAYDKDDQDRLQVTDPSVQHQLLQLAHQYHHEGQDPTKFRVDQIATWPSLKKDSKAIIDECEICARTQVKRGDHWFKIKPLPRPLPEWPFMKVQLDDLGPRYNKYHALLLIDTLFGYTLALPLDHTPTSDDVIKILRETHQTYGIFPSLVKSDRASYFVKAQTTLSHLPYAPVWEWSSGSQSVGMIERTIKEFNKKIRRCLAHLSIITFEQWSTTITAVTSEINSFPQVSAQGLSPRDLIFRHPAQHPITYKPTPLRISYADIDEIWRTHREKSRQQSYTRISVRDDDILVGDSVYVFNPKATKHQLPFSKPLKVTNITGNSITTDDGVVHHSSHLKKQH